MPQRPLSLLAPLPGLILPLFLASTILVAIVWIGGFGESALALPAAARRLPNADLRAALGVMARGMDAVWLTLGAVVGYLALVRAEGIAVARRWGAIIVGASFLIAAASAITGLPLGPVMYPPSLGWKIGPVPMGWPFLWLAIVIGARELVLRISPRSSHGTVAIATGMLCGLSDFLIEGVAWKYRAWWMWYPAQLDAPAHPPISSFATWVVAGMALAFAMRSPHIVPRVKERSPGPIIVFASVNAVALATRIVIGL